VGNALHPGNNIGEAVRGLASVSSASSENPDHLVSNLDHLVTQWKSAVIGSRGKAWNWFPLQCCGLSTAPTIVKSQSWFSARLDRQNMVEDLVGISSALRFLEFLVVPAVVQLEPWDA
jgi:hypothetical protein